MKWSKIALVLVLLVCASKALRWHLPVTLEDFYVYDTAAALVREHRSLLIYNGSDTGADPQTKLAGQDSIFAQEARRIGIPEVRLYVYPPVLADIVVPLSLLSAKEAGRVWFVLNIAALLGIFTLVLSMFHVPLRSLSALAFAVGIATFSPVLSCLRWGQILIVLALLWTIGVYCYLRGYTKTSGVALALATAIKLTPLIVVVPMLLWREWRWLRAYGVGLLVLLALVVTVNGPECLEDCFRHVMPSMSNGYPSLGNHSIISACQILYLALKHGDLYYPLLASIPHAVVVFGKVLDLICLAIGAALLARHRDYRDVYTRASVFTLFAMLSVIVSPVSWDHAYLFCLLGLAVLWAEALRAPVPKGYLILLALSSLELNWFSVTYLLRHFVHGVAFGLTAFSPIAFMVALVYYRLAAIPRFARLPHGGTKVPLTPAVA